MPNYTTPREMREWHMRRQARLEEIEADRQREADRLASEQNPPRKNINGHVIMLPKDCKDHFGGMQNCPLCDGGLSICMNCGTYEAGLDEPCKHGRFDPIPPEVLEARRAANEARRKRDGEHRQD